MKLTDRHKYLHFSSADPNHTKRSVVFSQALRISRSCSKESDFEGNKEKMRSWLVKREYHDSFLNKESQILTLEKLIGGIKVKIKYLV